MALTRREAKMIAEELYALMRPEVKQAATTIATDELDTWLSHEEAAKMLGYSVQTLYQRIDIPYTKVGRKRRYSRSALLQFLRG